MASLGSVFSCTCPNFLLNLIGDSVELLSGRSCQRLVPFNYSAEKKEQYGLLRVESLIEAWLLIELVKVQRIEREQMGEGNFLASHIHYLDIPLGLELHHIVAEYYCPTIL